MIGLIGGLGPAATVHYYRGLLAEADRRATKLQLLINHADVSRVLDLASRGDLGRLASYLADRAGELERGGATVLAIGAVTPHLCAIELSALVTAPLVDLIAVTQAEVQRREFRRVVLLGTRTVVESRMFGRLAEAIVPSNSVLLQQVHNLYLSIVQRGSVDAKTANALGSLASKLLISEQADGVVLAGTELALVPYEAWGSTPVLDCAGAHIQAILDAVHER